jgi:pimeloyl-ACP methyl ester carboxylesterase
MPIPAKIMSIAKRAGWLLLSLFILLNIIAAIQAWKFTHFQNGGIRTERIHLSPLKKVQLLFTGVDNPRPVNDVLPAHPYQTVVINSNVKIECWAIKAVGQPSKGSVILFHGYTSNKSALLDRAEVFLQNGYNCLLVDFMGSGGSGGDQTTIGYKEAEEVKDCYQYLATTGVQHIYLYGSSMGAVAIMKAVKDYNIQPQAIIIECPFGTMYETIEARFRMLHVPSFPMAGILLFWGSVENGFWGFSHCPVDDAKAIHCPTLLQYGEKDERVTRRETDEIYNNLPGQKQLITYPQAGHDDYLKLCKEEWSRNVIGFLNSH